MSDVVAQTAMCQCDKGGMHKLVVMVSPATGDSQSLSANGNCLLVPQGTPCSLLYGAPCPMVVNIVSKEGQSLVELSGSKALGADCEFMCPMGGKLTAQAHGQAIALHNEASAGLQIASFIADFVPIVCTIKSVIEVVTGVDPITGEATSRLAAAAGIIPGGKAVTKGGKIVKAIVKGEKGAAKAAKTAAKTEKAAASSAKAASKGEKAAAKNAHTPTAANTNSPQPKAANSNISPATEKRTVGEYTYKNTAGNHMDDVIKSGPNKGKLSRPYLQSPHTVNEITKAGKPIPDPGGVPGAVRYDVPGTFRGSEGTWELVVHPEEKVIYHFNFTK